MNIEQKLQKLRVEWTKYPERRQAIELQVKTLKLAQSAPQNIDFKDPFIQSVKKHLY